MVSPSSVNTAFDTAIFVYMEACAVIQVMHCSLKEHTKFLLLLLF